MKILQISTMNRGGGAALIPYNLFEAYRQRGHRSVLAVGHLRGATTDPDVIEIPNNECRGSWSRLLYALPEYLKANEVRGETRVRSLLQPLAEPRRAIRNRQGLEDFDYPGTERLLETSAREADIVHCHNLHGGYFDLRLLPAFGRNRPLVITMHDMWLLTGHCGYSIDCDRWKRGCGSCPDLSLYPAIARDATARNWQRKKDILGACHPHIVAPCQWMIECARKVIPYAASYHVITNGVDLSIFRPADKKAVRVGLGLPPEGKIVLFVGAYSKQNRYKDYHTVENAFSQIAAKAVTSSLTFVSLGHKASAVRRLGQAIVREYAYEHEPRKLAPFYQAADVFVHAATADNFPTVLSEASATGVPIVATAVGGIPEQVKQGETGFLVAKGDASDMALGTLKILGDEAFQRSLSKASARYAREHLDLEASVSAYLSLYEELLDNRLSTEE
jgi:glycosyltransferase involved in cell wall biosynthesis